MKICPKCGSENIDWIIPQNWSLWVCKTCEYTGPIIDCDAETAHDIRKKYIERLERENSEEAHNDSENDTIIEEDLSDEEIERRLDELHKSE